MKKSITCLVTLLLCAAMLLAMLAGCAESQTQEPAPAESEAAPVEEAPAPAESEAPPPAEEAPSAEEQPPVEETPPLPEKVEVPLPLVTEPTDVSMYLLIPPFITSMLDSITQISLLGALEERTGLTFDIVAGNYLDGSSVLNIMIASGEYPDIINHIDLYSSGAQSAIEDEVVIDLFDYVENDMPNFKHTLDSLDGAMKQLTTRDGYIAYFPQVLSEPTVDNFAIGLRTDLMEEQGLQEPKTYDQLHDVLASLKTAYDLQYGLQKNGLDQPLLTGYNLAPEYRVVDGKVQYCYMADEMYDYIKMISQWYSEGLILTDFIAYEYFAQNEMLTSGGLSGTGNVNPSTINEADKRGEGIVLSPIGYVTAKEGDEIKIYGQGMVLRSAAWSISTQCDEEKIPVICQMVEYLFSDEGRLLFNYGVEGEGYTLDENGEPQWSDLVINSESGFNTASFLYATGNPSEYICGIFDESKFYYNYNDRQFKAIEIINTSSTGEYDYPKGADGMISVDDRTTVANITGDLKTYVDETVLSWIMGETKLDDAAWQAFVDHCNSMDVQTVIDIYQKAYEDFLVK